MTLANAKAKTHSFYWHFTHETNVLTPFNSLTP